MSCPERSTLEEEVIAKLRPSKTQLAVISRFYSLLREKLASCLERRGLKARIEVEGSYAKGTMLSDKWEIDVFVLFKDVSDDWIMSESENILIECLKPLPLTVKYSQHPYVTVHLLGLEADIVPALWLDKPRPKGMGVERTPFHRIYVTEKIDQCLADDVRLLKSFLKGIGVYGAETWTGGFSGYLAELLIIWSGGFRSLINAMSGWRPTVYIDIEGVGDKEKLASKYRDSPLIVVDPIDPERNAAAAVTVRSLATAVTAAKLYKMKPSKAFFHIYKAPTLAARDLHVVVVECRGSYWLAPPQDIEGRLRRLETSLHNTLHREGFSVVKAGSMWDKWSRIAVYIVLESLHRPRLEVTRGPLAWMDERDIMRFVSKRLGRGEHVWIGSDGRLYGLKYRRYTSALGVVRDWLDKAPLPPGTSGCRVVACPGIGCTGWLERVAQHGLGLTPAWILGI